MKVIIHAGMQKTGSTSIQKTFARLNMPDHLYLPLEYPNHSNTLALMFQEPVEEYHRFAREGRSREDLLKDRQSWLERFERTLSTSNKENLIISGEVLTGLPYEETTKNFADFILPKVSEVRVITYVRPPVSYMNSGFIQSVKGAGLSSFPKNLMWPKYRGRMKRLISLFRKKNLEFVKFNRDNLKDGNVVLDFADRIGVDLPADKVAISNESLSLEALSVLFTYRKFAKERPSGFVGATQQNVQLHRKISQIGSQKFGFAPDLVSKVLERKQADLKWMERQMGEPLLDAPPSGSTGIEDEDQLIAIAIENLPAVQALLPEDQRIDGPANLETLFANLERLEAGLS